MLKLGYVLESWRQLVCVCRLKQHSAENLVRTSACKQLRQSLSDTSAIFCFRTFFRSVSVAIKGGRAHQGSANCSCFFGGQLPHLHAVFTRAASSRAHDG